MIRRYRYGTPYPTDAVVLELSIEAGDPEGVTRNGAVFTIPLGKRDAVFGLGESVQGMNKRGWRFESNNTDEPFHLEDKLSLYGTHNFFIQEGETAVGYFFDTTQRIRFDFGFTDTRKITVSEDEEDASLNLYVIHAEDDENPVLDICRQFRRLTGRSYVPPRWAFGYGQSRWGYLDEKDIRAVAEGYRAADMPLDMIYLDIDYMDQYMDFTVNKERFPDLTGLSADLKKDGIRLIPIIDAGVKASEECETDVEGLENGYFCRKEDGTVFTAAVWPGLSHFPDVFRKDVRAWFGGRYCLLLDQGIEGFWNDMNEPALFYTPEGLSRFREVYEAVFSKGDSLVHTDHWRFVSAVSGLANNPEDYRSFYHEIEGKQVRHDKVHNLYGTMLTKAAAEGIQKAQPDRRHMLFSRSSCIGMHRYSGIWTGDNKAWWSHLRLNVAQMPGLNMCGFLHSGADLGGFGSDVNEELLMRWMQFGIFTPLMRNHAALGTRNKELYLFERKEDFKNILRIRYALLPYIYSEFVKAAIDDGLYFRSLHMAYPRDAHALQVEDQLMVGESLMIAPVIEPNAVGRYVYLPETMKLLRMRSDRDYDEEILPAGHHYVEAAQNEVLLFIRHGHMILFAEPENSVDAMNFDHVRPAAFGDGPVTYSYYHDDGRTTDIDASEHRTTIVVE